MVSLDLGFGSVEVWLQSERTRLPEYETRSGPNAACWLPSVDGQVMPSLCPIFVMYTNALNIDLYDSLCNHRAAQSFRNASRHYPQENRRRTGITSKRNLLRLCNYIYRRLRRP